MLKLRPLANTYRLLMPAAFRRLCVETEESVNEVIEEAPAAFRRLCVETTLRVLVRSKTAPSRLQAAVC